MAVNASPTVPTESSVAAPSGGFSSWFRNIGDWLKSLSPSGSTEYETDWTDFALNSGFAAGVSVPQWKRIGKTYHFRGIIQPISGNFAPNATSILTASLSGLGSIGAADGIKVAWGPAAAGPVRIWIENAQIRIAPPPNATGVSYVALAGLSGVTVP